MWFGSDLAEFHANPPSNILQWMSSVCGASRSREKSISAISKVAVVGWFIWKARNNIVFNNGVLNPMEAVSKIRFARSELVEAFPADI